MGLFGKGKKKERDGANSANRLGIDDAPDEHRFEEEVRMAVDRYAQSHQTDLALRTAGGDRMRYVDALPEAFEEWKGIRSPWDRRSVIYQALDSWLIDNLPAWKVAERFLDDRYAEKALALLDEEGVPEEEAEEWWATRAKCLSVLGRYGDAQEAARNGLEVDADHERAQIQLADAAHMDGSHTAAHATYANLIRARVSSKQASEGKARLSFRQAVGFHEGGVYSPVYAIGLLEGGNASPDSAWVWAANDFYWSPYFRCRHAYHMLASKDVAAAFARLVTLSKEMPWSKEAALNSMQILEHLDPGGQNGLAAEDRANLADLIRRNEWTSEGMHPLEFP